jgi:hypothetical protein
MFETPNSLIDCATFNAENNVSIYCLHNINHTRPIHYAISACAANGGTGNFTAFCLSLLDADVFCVQVHQAIFDVL